MTTWRRLLSVASCLALIAIGGCADDSPTDSPGKADVAEGKTPSPPSSESASNEAGNVEADSPPGESGGEVVVCDLADISDLEPLAAVKFPAPTEGPGGELSAGVTLNACTWSVDMDPSDISSSTWDVSLTVFTTPSADIAQEMVADRGADEEHEKYPNPTEFDLPKGAQDDGYGFLSYGSPVLFKDARVWITMVHGNQVLIMAAEHAAEGDPSFDLNAFPDDRDSYVDWALGAAESLWD